MLANLTEDDLAQLWPASHSDLWRDAATDWRRLVAAEYAPRMGVERTAEVLDYEVSYSKSGPTSTAQRLATEGRKLLREARAERVAEEREPTARKASVPRVARVRVARAEALGGLLSAFTEAPDLNPRRRPEPAASS